MSKILCTSGQPRLLNLREVAHILHVSRSLVYLLIQRQQLTAVRFGHTLRVHPDDLEACILDKRLDYGRNAQEFLNRHRSQL